MTVDADRYAYGKELVDYFHRGDAYERMPTPPKGMDSFHVVLQFTYALSALHSERAWAMRDEIGFVKPEPERMQCFIGTPLPLIAKEG